MSAEADLPTELSEVESLLRQFSPANSAIDRERLMYQAGWAAADARWRDRKTRWFWPSATVALAASLLLVLTVPPASPLQPEEAEQVNSGIAVVEHALPAGSSEVEFVHTVPFPKKRYLPAATLLVLRDRALRQDFDDLPSNSYVDDLPLPERTTNRQLLQEFLPRARQQKGGAGEPEPMWFDWKFGETS